MTLSQQGESDESCSAIGPTTLVAPIKHDVNNGAAETRHPVFMRALVKAAAGTTAEVVTTVIFYPVELIRDRLAAAWRDDGFKYSSTFDGLLCVVQEEGLRGLYRGVWPTIVRTLASDFSMIFIGEGFIGCYRRFTRSTNDTMVLPLRILGGWVKTPLVMPLEIISTRVKTSRSSVSFLTAARILWQEGGVKAFFRSLNVMMVLSANPALTYTSFEWLRSLFCSLLRLTGLRDCSEQALSVAQSFFVGATAKMMTLMFVYPLIRGKFLLQARDTGEAGLVQVLFQVVSEDGFRGLYQGLGANLARSVASSALMLTLKDRIEKPWRLLLFGHR